MVFGQSLQVQSAVVLQAVEDLVKKYKTVGGLLRKVEEVVTGTNNGKAPQLAGYYAYWERSIFAALNNMVLNAMRMLVNMLVARSAKKAAAAGLPARPPLFKVTYLPASCYQCLLAMGLLACKGSALPSHLDAVIICLSLLELHALHLPF